MSRPLSHRYIDVILQPMHLLTWLDSWIEISTRPSSSSLSSQENNDIVTIGLSVRPGGRPLQLNIAETERARSTSVAGSSQDEYEESESDSDRVMSSSNEDNTHHVDDEDEVATAIGMPPRNAFTPQPNAFSHPPQTGQIQSTPGPDSYFPSIPPTSFSDRLPSNRMITQQTITQRSIRREFPTIPHAEPDHDAALRASLTTLLSCAAAVRPPKELKDRAPNSTTRPSVQPTSLRIVQESDLDASPRIPKPNTKRRSRESSKERHAKKIRALKGPAVNDEVLSPTVMSWMISAGVVLVFSAISFSAGYAWGREVGRIEGELGANSVSCGREALKSGGELRRLRWSAATQSARV